MVIMSFQLFPRAFSFFHVLLNCLSWDIQFFLKVATNKNWLQAIPMETRVILYFNIMIRFMIKNHEILKNFISSSSSFSFHHPRRYRSTHLPKELWNPLDVFSLGYVYRFSSFSLQIHFTNPSFHKPCCNFLHLLPAKAPFALFTSFINKFKKYNGASKEKNY